MGSATAAPSAADLAAITAAAKTYNVPLSLSLAIADQESGFQQTNSSGGVLTSKTGAQGIYQLEPETAAGLGVNATNEQQNIIGGNKYLGQLYAQYGGDQTKTIEAYNARPGAAAAAGFNVASLPAETQAYVPAVTALANGYASTPAGGGSSATSSVLGALQVINPLFGVAGAIATPVGGAIAGAAAGATNTAVSAVFNELTAEGFTEKITQFTVICLIIIAALFVRAPRGA